jgi:excisionase family DNA binding protein
MPPREQPAPAVLPDGSVVIPPTLAAPLRALLLEALTARTQTAETPIGPVGHALLAALREGSRTAAYGPRPDDTDPASSAAGTSTPAPATVITDAGGDPGSVTTGEAAALIGSSAEWVRRLARRGTLPGHRIGSVWLIDRAALDDYRHGRTAA